jgi:hypothetical protein
VSVLTSCPGWKLKKGMNGKGKKEERLDVGKKIS